MNVIVDFRMKPVFIDFFKSLGFNVIKMLDNKALYDEICAHPDIFACNINNTVIMAENSLTDKNIEGVIYGESVENPYPLDIKYNVCVNKKLAICNEKHISGKVKDEILKQNLRIIDVNQGYVRCSTLSLNDENYITSDISIKQALEKNSCNVLYIENEDIKLLDRNGKITNMTGFIGGATCIVDNKVILFGDKDKLKCKNRFEEFILRNGYTLIDFKGEDIIDYGSVIITK